MFSSQAAARSARDEYLADSRRSDHRSSPGGGAEHANAITLASTSPVTIGSTGGVSRFFRLMVPATSPPRSAYAFETFTTVSTCTPARRAISSCVGAGS